jgi:hypothetical protein
VAIALVSYVEETKTAWVVDVREDLLVKEWFSARSLSMSALNIAIALMILILS